VKRAIHINASRLISGLRTLYANVIVASKDNLGSMVPKSACSIIRDQNIRQDLLAYRGHQECDSISLSRCLS